MPVRRDEALVPFGTYVDKVGCRASIPITTGGILDRALRVRGKGVDLPKGESSEGQWRVGEIHFRVRAYRPCNSLFVPTCDYLKPCWLTAGRPTTHLGREPRQETLGRQAGSHLAIPAGLTTEPFRSLLYFKLCGAFASPSLVMQDHSHGRPVAGRIHVPRYLRGGK